MSNFKENDRVKIIDGFHGESLNDRIGQTGTIVWVNTVLEYCMVDFNDGKKAEGIWYEEIEKVGF